MKGLLRILCLMLGITVALMTHAPAMATTPVPAAQAHHDMPCPGCDDPTGGAVPACPAMGGCGGAAGCAAAIFAPLAEPAASRIGTPMPPPPAPLPTLAQRGPAPEPPPPRA